MSTRFINILNQPIDDILPVDIFSVADVIGTEGINENSMLVEAPTSDYGQPRRKSKDEFVIWLKKRTKHAAINIVNLMEKTGNYPGVNVVRYRKCIPLIKQEVS
ncbi:MAG: hypothetical protein AB8H12_15050 [Lewinella sp.]